MALIDDIKNALRESGNDLNTEIQDLIDSATADLILSGIHKDKAVDTDALIKRAITIYCKAHFGYDEQADRFQQSYNMLKSHLALSQEYTVGE